MVYVVDIDGQPLMPTERSGKVRRMLKDGKAKVVRSRPFTIQLLYDNIDLDVNGGITNMDQQILSNRLKQLEEQANQLQQLVSKMQSEVQGKNASTIINWKNKAIDLSDLAPQLSELHKAVFKAIGEKGLSTTNDIVSEVELNTKYKDSQIRTAIKEMQETHQILNKENGATAIVPRRYMYSLNFVGRFLYKYMFGKNPVLSEAEKLRRMHSTLLHGLCIKDTIEILTNLGYSNITQIEEENTFNLPNGETYIPDIIAETNIGKRIYWDVELGHHNDKDFANKLDKALKVTDTLVIITDKKDSWLKVKLQVERYSARRKYKNDKTKTKSAPCNQMTVYIGTMNQLKDGTIFDNVNCRVVID